MNDDTLDPTLRAALLARLGLPTQPLLTLEGLTEIYRAWCHAIPFDNLTKMLALREGRAGALPGGHATDFFNHWLAHGAGGTCWSTSNALYTLIRSLGFEARRVTGAMRDLGLVTHASTKVRLDGRDWLVDSSFLCNAPLPLDDAGYISPDPVFAIEVERDAGTHVIWSASPGNPDYLPCRLVGDPVTHEEYLARYEASRDRSPFNQRLYARWNRPGEANVLHGNTHWVRTARGTTTRTLEPVALRAVLHTELGVSNALIQVWVEAGGLEASLLPPSGSKPPPVNRLPPSQR